MGERWTTKIGLLLLGTLLVGGGVRASDDLTPAERARLGKEAAEQNAKALALYQQGQLVAATKLAQPALATYQRLYPKETYPSGHPDLARSLVWLALLLEARGELAQAEPYYRDALAMYQQLYPKEKYPAGHRDLARSYHKLGGLLQAQGDLAQAEAFHRDALAMRQQLYPREKFPAGHRDLIASIVGLGVSLKTRGELAQAEPFFRDALVMCRQLYPKDEYPNGHADLAASLNNLTVLMQARGDLAQAEAFCRDALTMYQQLYSKDKFPTGHPALASSLNNLGFLRSARGQLAQAEPLYRDALAMRQQLYPNDKFPAGHGALAQSFNNLGLLLQARGDLAQAELFCHDALAMNQRLYPKDKFPGGYPDLAASLNNLGFLLGKRGDLAQAEAYYREAVAMYRQLHPKGRFPAGHPDLAQSLSNLGTLVLERGEATQAEPYCRDALAMYQALTEAFADRAAEAEALNFVAALPIIRDVHLALTARLDPYDPATAYALFWPSKAALAQVLERRRRLIRSLDDDGSRQKLLELLETRRQLATLVLAPAAGRPDPGRDKRLRDLSTRKELLEGELARSVPELALQQARLKATPVDLAARLPAKTAFVDFFRYFTWTPKTRKWGEPAYAAFVLTPGQPARRIELGEAKPLDDALRRWRQAIAAGKDNEDAAALLRRGLWDKLALPTGTTTVWVCPDGLLSALPWAALPGSTKGTVLGEACAVALVPHGPLLWEQLGTRAKPAGALLALGGVAYDQAPDAIKKGADDLLAQAHKPDRAGKDGTWPELPGTTRELGHIVALARRLPQALEVRELRGSAAGPHQLLAELPHARWAHLATHGFFAAPGSDERKQLYRPDDFLLGLRRERVGVAARHPLTQTGLVLAGANRPGKEGEDSCILTAEALAGLPLDRLELAVLSACQTGLGEAATGEGVFGLQRAFHLAGTRNVIASLWKVDDEATAALMAVFYHKLWMEKQPPLEALRQAQLALLRHPHEIPALAKSRGPNFDETVQRVGRPSDPKAGKPATLAPVKDWAAFVLSGAGR